MLYFYSIPLHVRERVLHLHTLCVCKCVCAYSIISLPISPVHNLIISCFCLFFFFFFLLGSFAHVFFFMNLCDLSLYMARFMFVVSVSLCVCVCESFVCQFHRALGFLKLWPAKRAWSPNSSSILQRKEKEKERNSLKL